MWYKAARSFVRARKCETSFPSLIVRHKRRLSNASWKSERRRNSVNGGGPPGAPVGVVVAHRVLDEPGSLGARNDVSVFRNIDAAAAEIACMSTERHVRWGKNRTGGDILGVRRKSKGSDPFFGITFPFFGPLLERPTDRVLGVLGTVRFRGPN